MRHTAVMSRMIPRRAEKDFYLTEFRGRSLGLVLEDGPLEQRADLRELLAELADMHDRASAGFRNSSARMPL